MSLLDCKQIGTVEILRARTYALDSEAPEAYVTGIVSPGVFPLYQIGDAKFWMLEGVLNFGGIQRVGDGLFVAAGGDMPSELPVRFPSRTFGPRDWKELLALPTCQEGHDEQRLRIVEVPA